MSSFKPFTFSGLRHFLNNCCVLGAYNEKSGGILLEFFLMNEGQNAFIEFSHFLRQIYTLPVPSLTIHKSFECSCNVEGHLTSYTSDHNFSSCNWKLVIGIVIFFLKSAKAWKVSYNQCIVKWLHLVAVAFSRSCNENHLFSGSYSLIGWTAAPC